MSKSGGAKRHCHIGDTQIRANVPQDHLPWVGQALVEYEPDVIVHAGDHYDMPSCGDHDKPGSLAVEGQRYKDDIETGRHAFDVLCKPMENHIAALRKNHKRRWEPRKLVTIGNHEDRADRVAKANPRLLGTVGTADCTFRDWEIYPFLERVFIDGICYSHYFQNTHSSYPIGGEISTRLSKIGCSFVQGHEQGRRIGEKIMGSGKTLYGIVNGSCYLHIENYRGRQGQRHWRGVMMMNEVEDGEYDIMPLSLRYLCKKYEGMALDHYMKLKYPNCNWDHLK